MKQPVRRRSSLITALSILLVLKVSVALAIVAGNVDDFEDGTTQGWRVGNNSSSPPANIASGGPLGVGDNYLRNVSFGGFGPDGRWIVFNRTQWTGDFFSSGITEVRLQAQIQSGGATKLRIGFGDASGNRFVSTVALDLPADGMWHSLAFPIDEQSLTDLGGPGTYESTMSAISETRILVSEAAPAWNGDRVAMTIGLDNIEAYPPPVDAPHPCASHGTLPIACALPDINDDDVPDVVVFRDGSIQAEIRDGASGGLVGSIDFLSDGFTPIAAGWLPDSDANGVIELAVLASRNSDGRNVVEMRNVTGNELKRQVWFAANHTARALAIIDDDADNNGITELAVLSIRDSDGRGLVEVKNAAGPTNPRSLFAGPGLTPIDIEIVRDADSNSVSEVAILSSRDSDGRIVVELKNAAGATLPNSVWFAPGLTAIDLAAVADKDKNGIPEVAVLSSRDADGRVVVEVKNASGPTMPNRVWLAPGLTAQQVEMVRDADRNGVPEVAVLSTRDSDGRIRVDVKNVFGPKNPVVIWYSPGFSAQGLTLMDDANEDFVPEANVLMLRDSDNRILLQRRAADRALGAIYYWFSP